MEHLTGRIEIYTPWREDIRALQSRTVGRDAILARLDAALASFSKGGRPLHRYLFGPRGAGKSHLLSLLRARFRELGLQDSWVGEDIPAIQSAAELLRRVDDGGRRRPAWWGSEPHRADGPPTRARPTVIVIEGLDRRLEELGQGPDGRRERQALRARWDQDPNLWILATGVDIPTSLSSSAEPFFGWFDPEPVGLLDDADAESLLDRLVPDSGQQAWWAGRRSALVTLAGGSPRVLVTLAETCASPQTPEAASDALLAAVERFTPHFQLRFRDLSPQGQAIIDRLATSPRELSPSELAQQLSLQQANVGATARRLDDDGVLVARHDGRNTWYRIAEPLFRFWIEYRTADWERTRVALATNLLEAILSPEEIVRHWLDAEDAPGPVVKRSVRSVRSGRAAPGAQAEVERRIGEAVRDKDKEQLARLLGRARSVRQLAAQAAAAQRSLVEGWADGLREVGRIDATGLLGATSRASADLIEHVHTPREVFRQWLRHFPGPTGFNPGWRIISQLLLGALDATAGVGTSWTLTDHERGHVASLPFLRAAFLRRGRLASHRPILDVADLASVALRPGDGDLGVLLSAALLCHGDDLASRVLQAVVRPRVSAAAGPPGINPLPMNPAPQATLLVRWTLAALHSDLMSTTDALTWARSYADIDEPAFGELLAEIGRDRPPPHRPARMSHWRAGEGLVALGLVNPERLDLLLGALPPSLGDLFQDYGPFARQLRDRPGGALHPELARVRDRLSGT